MKILLVFISSIILYSIGEFVEDVNFFAPDDDLSEEEFLDEDPNDVVESDPVVEAVPPEIENPVSVAGPVGIHLSSDIQIKKLNPLM